MDNPMPGAYQVPFMEIDAPLEPLTVAKFLSLQIPPRQNLLSPILPEKSVCMLFGPRGCGKTQLGVGMAVAVSSGGSFLRWKAERPCKVLYIDGEMPAAGLIERFVAATAGLSETARAMVHANLSVLASDLRLDGLPDLSTIEGQARFAGTFEGFDLIVADNISTLCRTGKENEAESWGALQSWALEQRRAGRSVLFIHHAGKNGAQRGTSRREDIMDTVIMLSRPDDYKASEGARMIVEFTKARGIMGDDAESFEAQLKDGQWLQRGATSVRDEKIVALHLEGLKQRDIAEDVGVGVATVNRVIRRHAVQHPALDGDGG